MFLPFAFYDDKILPLRNIKIPPTDLGIQRGYSVFDFFKLVHFKSEYIDWYLDRLSHSATSVGLDLPYERSKLVTICKQLFEANSIEDGYIKIIVSAGPSTDGYTAQNEATLLIFALPIVEKDPLLYRKGGKLITKNYTRDLPHVKSTYYIVSAMMAPKLKQADAVDILYHNNTSITECTRCTFYIVKEGQIWTPQKNVLQGITRKRILTTENPELKVIEKEVLLTDLDSAEEAFISSTSKGVMPITKIDDQKIGSGNVGPFTKALMGVINVF